MKLLVTGATSRTGSGLVDQFLARGDEVNTLQRRRTGVGDARVEFVGDIADEAAVAAAVEGCDAVVHLAAKVDVVGPWRDYHRTNVVGTRVVLHQARRAGVGVVVHVSTPSVAHAGAALVGAGADPADPTATRGHYATSKALAEQAALAADADGFAVVAIRPHLVWGPGDTQLVGRVVQRAREGRLVVVGSGEALVDTTYIDNAVDALTAAVDRGADLGGRALVVSNGEPRPIGELLAAIVAAAGLPAPRRHVPWVLAFAAGLVVERVWERFDGGGEPPITSFLAEQLATAHWFEQVTSREALDWTPAVSIDEGLVRLAASFADGASA